MLVVCVCVHQRRWVWSDTAATISDEDLILLSLLPIYELYPPYAPSSSLPSPPPTFVPLLGETTRGGSVALPPPEVYPLAIVAVSCVCKPLPSSFLLVLLGLVRRVCLPDPSRSLHVAHCCQSVCFSLSTLTSGPCLHCWAPLPPHPKHARRRSRYCAGCTHQNTRRVLHEAHLAGHATVATARPQRRRV